MHNISNAQLTGCDEAGCGDEGGDVVSIGTSGPIKLIISLYSSGHSSSRDGGSSLSISFLIASLTS